jgi:hypothetical protein
MKKTAQRQNQLASARGFAEQWGSSFLEAQSTPVMSSMPLAPMQHQLTVHCTPTALEAEADRLEHLPAPKG